jgi:Do/DeqQ family serine protease
MPFLFFRSAHFGFSAARLRWLRVVLSAILLLPFTAPQAVLPIQDSQGQQLPSLAPMIKKAGPSVVNISTFATQTVRQNPLLNDPFFRRFFNVPEGQQLPQSRRSQSAGSGVIIDAERGTVVTNYHVIDGADEIHVGLQDGRSFRASLIGSDPKVDIAVLKLEAFDGLTALPVTDSDLSEVGDFVVAIGNPFGLGQTVTTGVVSALGRSGLGIDYENFIQTDASINPGNSGGALVNLRGELIGINTAIIAPAGGNVGIGFAIPSNMAMSSIDQILEFGEVKRGQLGIIIQDLSRELAAAFGIDKQQQGVVIAQVQAGSAAEDAGLKAGDVVISIDGAATESAAQLRVEIGRRRIGDELKLTVLRDGRSKVIAAKVGESRKLQSNSAKIHPLLAGATLLDVANGGVQISVLEPGSAAASSGLREGDVILSANQYQVNTLKDLRRVANRADNRLALRIRRGYDAFYLVLQ